MLKKKLLELRFSKNWTQTQLAQFSGISQPLLAGYENGKNASKKTLQRLADTFQVPIEEFISIDTIEKEVFDEVEFARAINELKKLPVDDKKILKDVIEVFLTQHRLREERAKFMQLLSKGNPRRNK